MRSVPIPTHASTCQQADQKRREYLRLGGATNAKVCSSQIGSSGNCCCSPFTEFLLLREVPLLPPYAIVATTTTTASSTTTTRTPTKLQPNHQEDNLTVHNEESLLQRHLSRFMLLPAVLQGKGQVAAIAKRVGGRSAAHRLKSVTWGLPLLGAAFQTLHVCSPIQAALPSN